MAVVNVKSTLVSNVDSDPVKNNPAALAEGRVYQAVASVEIANGDSIGSTYRMMRVHSSWRLSSIKVFNDAIATTGAADVGLYDIKDGAVVDADAYASAHSLVAGSSVGVEVLFESGVKAIEELGEQVWEDAGLSKDSDKWYDLVATLTAAAGGAGTLAFVVQFTRGGS